MSKRTLVRLRLRGGLAGEEVSYGLWFTAEQGREVGVDAGPSSAPTASALLCPVLSWPEPRTSPPSTMTNSISVNCSGSASTVRGCTSTEPDSTRASIPSADSTRRWSSAPTFHQRPGRPGHCSRPHREPRASCRSWGRTKRRSKPCFSSSSLPRNDPGDHRSAVTDHHGRPKQSRPPTSAPNVVAVLVGLHRSRDRIGSERLGHRAPAGFGSRHKRLVSRASVGAKP